MRQSQALDDGDGRRVYKSSGKLYRYGPEASGGSEILAETDGSGTVTTEYVYFGGKRIAMLPAAGSPQYYVEDFLGSSRVVTQSNGVVCYDADFTPFGGDISYTNSCPAQNNYKFEGKERDTETGNDDFGARYYTWRFGRWLSADWSSVPVAVPYANLTNPQTLNLYAMVADDPESFADLDGHCGSGSPWTQCKDSGNADGGPEALSCSAHPESCQSSDDDAREQGAIQSQQKADQKSSQKKHRKHRKPKPKGLPASGDASIYSDWFEGKTTANGETFYQSGNTAALLPKSRWHAVKLGTRVRLKRGARSVVVEINDRGAGDRNPDSTRVLDLSRAAAAALTGKEINDDDDAKKVGLIHLDSIELVPADTPLGPAAPQPPQ